MGFCFAPLAKVDISNIKEGAYKGKAFFGSSPKHPLPGSLFIIVANGYISGVFAQENEPILAGFFNQTELLGKTYTLKVSEKVIKFKTNGKKAPRGTARLVKSSDKLTSGLKGYYVKVEDLGFEEPLVSFLNIGPDGSAIAVLPAFSGSDFGNIFYGKVDESGNFNQDFGVEGITISTELILDGVNITRTTSGGGMTTVTLALEE